MFYIHRGLSHSLTPLYSLLYFTLIELCGPCLPFIELLFTGLWLQVITLKRLSNKTHAGEITTLTHIIRLETHFPACTLAPVLSDSIIQHASWEDWFNTFARPSSFLLCMQGSCWHSAELGEL